MHFTRAYTIIIYSEISLYVRHSHGEFKISCYCEHVSCAIEENPKNNNIPTDICTQLKNELNVVPTIVLREPDFGD